jgi:hypothetical protein
VFITYQLVLKFQSSTSSPTSSTSPEIPSVARSSNPTIQRPRGPPPSIAASPAAVGSQPKLPELILPAEDSMWDVYVTHIFSSIEVCVRLLGDDYSSKFEDLITDMELHYYDADKVNDLGVLKIYHPVHTFQSYYSFMVL